MKFLLKILSLIVVFVFVSQRSFAQYYSWGADRPSLRWSTIAHDEAKVLYPDTVEHTAQRMMCYINAVHQDVDFGFSYPALDIPFVVHPDNFASNGMVMWMPIRVEFLSTPSIDSYSMPWIKQLVAHEYRHAVQYNNLDRSTTKVFSRIFGQQGAALSLLFPPLYALEGDAVMSETNMSSYGRGLQPSFSIGYRALADELLDKKNYLKWRCGSYTGYIPDHYRMGYQIMSYAYDKYNENILDKVFRYVARNPQFISPYSIALNKYYDTSTKKLLYETFADLKSFWESQPYVEDSSTILSSEEKDNFVTYSYPIQLQDKQILVLKKDYKEPSRFVLFDQNSLSEKLVAHTGSISTRPAYAAGRVWWTEYRRSPLFAEDVNSELCYMDVEEGRTRTFKGYKSALYPTPIGESVDHIAVVEYNPTGQYTVVELDGKDVVSRTEIAYPNEVHSMAWDNKTQRLYIIVTGDDGMWIEQQTSAGFDRIIDPAYVTISNLTARDGVLYFGSIASGKDEVHSLDLASGVQRQLSESTYGSFQPFAGDSEVYMTTYDKLGYHLSCQSDTIAINTVEYSNVPRNLVNPDRKSWDVINLDTITFDSVAKEMASKKYTAKRYRKGAHLFNVHSWAPIRFNPLTILSELNLNSFGVGATLVSQNLLSSCEGFLSYGWDRDQGSVLRGGANYNGLGVDLSLSATYGGRQNLYMVTPKNVFDAGMSLTNYADVNFSVTLPLYFSRGYWSSSLSSYVGWNYSNGIVPKDLAADYYFDPETKDFSLYMKYSGLKRGLNKLSAGVVYSNYVQSAYRDLDIPLGYTVSASTALDLFNSDFSQLISLYTKLYTPGFAQNNSFTVSAAYQDNIGGCKIGDYSVLSYVSSLLIPTGFTTTDITSESYLAASAQYKFPVCHPDLSVLDLLYFKRLSLGFGADYAQFNELEGSFNSLYSYGVDLYIDLNAISMTSASTLSLSLSLYKPQDRNLYFKFGLGLPF